jgi:hypothetical protein
MDISGQCLMKALHTQEVMDRLRSWRRPPPAAARCDATAPHCQKYKAFNDVDVYAVWPKVVDTVLKRLSASLGTETRAADCSLIGK